VNQQFADGGDSSKFNFPVGLRHDAAAMVPQFDKPWVGYILAPGDGVVVALAFDCECCFVDDEGVLSDYL